MLSAKAVRFCQLTICSKYLFHRYLVLALLLANGCAAVQAISEEALQQKVAKIKLGITTKAEIETLFGKEQTTGDFTSTYNLSDTALAPSKSLAVSKGPAILPTESIGSFPIVVGRVPTNTRALITVTFNPHQTVSTLQIKRFFNPPFINDYLFLELQPELNSATKIGDVRVSGSVGEADTGSNNGQILVEFKQSVLHVTSINPYDRLSNEYRVFVKREREFINTISASTMRNCERMSKLARQYMDSPIRTFGHLGSVEIKVGCIDSSAGASGLPLKFPR